MTSPIHRSREGLNFNATGSAVMQEVHTGSRMHNLGDLLLTLPAHAVVNITFDHPTGGEITFRAMAREIPFGREAGGRVERRYTMLDSGGEFFLKTRETHLVMAVILEGQG